MRVHQLQKGQFKFCRSLPIWLIALLFVFGCAATSQSPPERSVEPQTLPPPVSEKEGPRRIETRPRSSLLPLAALKPKVAASEKMPYESKLFSLSARSTPLRDVLLGLSKQAELNLVIERGVDYEEPVSVELHDLPLATALDMVLNAYGYFYDIDGNILRVKALETKIFHFDYPLMVKSMTSSVGGDMLGTSGQDRYSGNRGGGRGSGSNNSNALQGEFKIETSVDTGSLDIWQQLEAALSSGGSGGGSMGLLSSQGRVQINELSGTILVTDRRENLILVERYLDELETVLSRQIIIEANIIEVTLNDQYKYGIRWDILSREFLGTGGDLQFLSDFTTGGGNIALKFFNDDGKNAIGGFIEALSQQGNVDVLASPRISALNNQTALITVARNIPYIDWQLSSIQDPNDVLGRLTQLVPTTQNTRVGISLGVTPQIDENGVATLHIVPVITDLVGFKEFTQDGDTWDIPIINMRATDSIVRARNGSTIVLGGLILERIIEGSTGIPFLGDIPYVGQILFSGQERESEKRELVIMLNPTIIEQ
jgi:MSHA biogenesis protein MshL